LLSVSAVSANRTDDQSPKIVYATETTGGKVDLNKLPPEERSKLEARFNEIQSLFVERAIARGKLVEAKKNGDNILVNKAYDDVSALDLKAKQIGLVKLDEIKQSEGEVSIQASIRDDFIYDYKDFYWDTTTSKFVWEAQGQFDSGNDWASECNCIPYHFTYDLGGDDGFGLSSLHKDINIYTSEMWTLDSDLSNATNRSGGQADINARGVAWEWQDDVYAGFFGAKTYDSHRRLAWMYFDFVGGTPSGQNISFLANVAHTWDETDLSGTEVGTGGVTFTFNKATERWDKPVNGVYTVPY
jgi:hypothetical protein